MNIILITSLINPPDLPFSYINKRSIYTSETRFEQTKKTIESVKKNIPEYYIIFIEASLISEHQTEYFQNNTNYFVNLFQNQRVMHNINSMSKALGECTLIQTAIDYIVEQKLDYKNFFKLSGRYWINEKFNYDSFNNDYIIVKKINNDINNIVTILYKLPKNLLTEWYNFINNSKEDLLNCIGAEVLFARFVNTLNNYVYIDSLGVQGNIAVSGDEINI